MPPNTKFPAVALGLNESELIDVARNSTGCSAHPPPPTLDEAEGDDTFFLHDIEENISSETPAPVPSPAPHENENIDDPEHPHRHENAGHHHHARVITHLASQITDPEQLTIDDRRLSRAVRDAGEFSYGVIACEVWLLDEDKLVRPTGGWWHNSKLYHYESSNNTSSLLDELETTEPAPVLPGVDLPGILWAETVRDGSRGALVAASTTSRTESGFVRNAEHRSIDELDMNALTHHRHHSIMTPHASHMGRSGPSMEGLVHLNLHNNPHALFWRDLRSIAEDPDSAKTARLGQLMDAGLCVAAGVPFHVRDHRGLVIYFARSYTRTHLLSNVANNAFLKASAQMIGHAAALSEIRRASVETRRRYNKDATARFRRNLLEFRKNKESIPDDLSRTMHEQDKFSKDCGEGEGLGPTEERSISEGLPSDQTTLDRIYHGIHTWCHKCRGGNLQVPPALTFRQSLWTTIGAFCSLLVLSSLNEYYKILSDNDYFLLIGPFGALMTLQYGLTAAPASQPRNVVLGQAVSGAVSLAFTYIPESILAVWLRQAVGPAVAIGVMVKCGVTHPPAGAHAVLYASGKYNFGFYALVVLSSAISIVPATLVNNLSSKRQYPTYWTLLKLPFKSGGGTKEGTE